MEDCNCKNNQNEKEWVSENDYGDLYLNTESYPVVRELMNDIKNMELNKNSIFNRELEKLELGNLNLEDMEIDYSNIEK